MADARFEIGLVGEYLAEAILPDYLGCTLVARTDKYRDQHGRCNYDYDVVFEGAHRFGGDIIYGLDAKVKSYVSYHPSIDGVKILYIDQFKYHDYIGIVNDEGRDNIKFYFLFVDRSTYDIYLISDLPDYTNLYISSSEFNTHGKNPENLHIAWDLSKHKPIVRFNKDARYAINRSVEKYTNEKITKEYLKKYIKNVYKKCIAL
ncbi:hypothetical protein AVU32_gp179 [Vibrio phage ValKK3]|uniref:Uncharacterized protein n=2 Tax=Schizotequatrovirus valkk3 TaxID=1914021 RepID=A0A140B3H6_9CAUD|nr:hypothetical protein AVU32_gp179 [Vibrio phage ValKK3]AJT61020.1 hypothetical protein [Vibrio phage ValKK3]ALP47066.1 hypothetical protein phiGrn1_0196 [Vibrio phage phi-Grn1]